MANLAILGHATRGKEVIEILEMLGGKNSYKVDAIRDYYVYFIEDEIISTLKVKQLRPNQFTIFTLEDFLAINPYKVGDKVKYTSEDFTIIGMKWDCRRGIVIYTMKNNCSIIDCYDSTWMKPYKEQETIEEPTIRLSPEQLYGEQVIIPIPKGYEFICVDDDNQQVVFEKIKSKYPKTYKECCDILEVCTPFDLGNLGNLDDKYLFIDFIRLKRCRDAYWKLYDNWKPDFTKDDIKYSIEFIGDELLKCEIRLQNTFLCFPTEEMRDSFYNNFKSLIVPCKELF